MGRAYFHGIDAIRFAAAMLVMVFHLGFWMAFNPDGLSGTIGGGRAAYPELSFAWFGFVGVQVFFVISGLVIANSAQDGSALGFLKSRLLRLYPAAWVCATVTLMALLAFGAPSLRQYLASLLLLPIGPWVDGVYWTLAVEVQFYALVFVVLLLGGPRHMPKVAAGLALASAAYVLADWFIDLPAMFLARHACFFALGICIWMGRWSWPAWLALVTGCAEIWLRVTRIDAEGWAPMAVWLVGVALIVAATRVDLSRFDAVLRPLGLATYPLYLLHNVVGAALIRLAVDAGVHRFAALALAMAAVLLLSFAIALWAEPKVRRGLDTALTRALVKARLAPA